MFSLFTSRSSSTAFAARAATALTPNHTATGVAHQLMERADAGAGRDPHRAQELRDAALAFLSVVR